MKKCGYCGRENNDASVVCSECGVELPGPSVPEIERQLTDPAYSLVTVATFSSLQEASLLVDRLDLAGIEACIPEEYSPQVFSAVIPLERLTVRVAAKDYEAAKAILADPPGVEQTFGEAGGSESAPDAGEGGPQTGDESAKTEPRQAGKVCLACGEPIPAEAITCAKCGWTQPPSVRGWRGLAVANVRFLARVGTRRGELLPVFHALERRLYGPQTEGDADLYGLDLCLRARYEGHKCLELFDLLEHLIRDFLMLHFQAARV